MLTHDELIQAIPLAFEAIDLAGWGPKQSGKVRDIYSLDNRRILITTDRFSAFDRVLGAIPFKGQVLNQLSVWWFEHTRDIVENHLIAAPDPNVMIVREAKALPVEVIVRGYITGVTSTSLWTLYEQGERRPYGIELPDGLRKNDPLPTPIITPTTKATGGKHDERLTRDEIIESGLVERSLWERVEEAALGLFKCGQSVATLGGLNLVDTKYEFGLIGGKLVVIDEIHTPDSSRYWVRDSSQPGGEPLSLDKEFLRLWYVEHGYRGEGDPPTMPDDIIAQAAARYIEVYERLTGFTFVPGELPAAVRIAGALDRFVAEKPL